MKNIYAIIAILILCLVCSSNANAESKSVTMKVGDTGTLYLPTSVTSKNLKSVTFYSNGISYVQVVSYNNLEKDPSTMGKFVSSNTKIKIRYIRF